MPTARRDTCSDAKESPFPTFFKGKVYLNPLNHCAGETGLLHGISPWGRLGWGLLALTPSPWKAEMGLLVYYVFSISLWEYRYSQQDIYLY